MIDLITPAVVGFLADHDVDPLRVIIVLSAALGYCIRYIQINPPWR